MELIENRTFDEIKVGDVATLERISALSIPPAWKNVWISPDPLGHIAKSCCHAPSQEHQKHQKSIKSVEEEMAIVGVRIVLRAGVVVGRRRVFGDDCGGSSGSVAMRIGGGWGRLSGGLGDDEWRKRRDE